MDHCHQLASDSSMVESYKSSVGHTLLIMGIILGVALMLCLCAVGIFTLGYYHGKRSEYKTKVDKMTMSPVTYTSLRGVAQPRFEYYQWYEGCW